MQSTSLYFLLSFYLTHLLAIELQQFQSCRIALHKNLLQHAGVYRCEATAATKASLANYSTCFPYVQKTEGPKAFAAQEN